MAVNGVEIEVGQVWETRGSGLMKVTGPNHNSGTYPWSLENGHTVTYSGLVNHDSPGNNSDLISLITSAPIFVSDEIRIPTPRTLFDAKPIDMAAPGYECLANVLQMAYNQAAVGKGVERHAAAGEPFADQVMQVGAAKFGTGALLFQAFKKSEESQRLPHDRAVNELLGAIVYLAGAVIALEKVKVATC